MQKPDFNESQWMWDSYREFHIRQENLVYFKTGEVICTVQAPNLDNRHGYPGGLRLGTTDKSGSLWAPDGRELKNAWLYDNGMQHLFIDEHTNKCVRLDCGPARYRDHATGKIVSGHAPASQEAPFLPGVPERFQANAYAYIGGPGCHPVGNGKIVAWVPLAKALDKDAREHVTMIETSARTAMKLTDDKRIENTPSWGHTTSPPITKGVPLEIILKCQTWQDVPEAKLTDLWHGGVQRAKWEFDWCYWDKPAHAVDA